MPAVSQRQYRFMKGVESGSIKAPGLSKKDAAEFTRGQKTKGLPEKKRKKRKAKR